MKASLFVTVLAFFLAATTQATAQSAKARDVITAFYTAVDAGDLAAVEQLSTPDFMAHVPVSPQPFNLPVWKQFLTGFKTGFPDMRHEILDWVSDGKKLAVRGVFTGTNTGSMQGNPPTGNKVSLPFNTFFELDKDLKIKALYVQFDQVAFQQQLMAGLPGK